MAAVIADAARQGFPDAGRLWRMSLSEAARALEGYAAARRAQDARDERLAWMAGYYAALAVHAPGRYPRRSGTAFHAVGAAMTEAQMKDALLAFAAGQARKEGFSDDTGDAED